MNEIEVTMDCEKCKAYQYERGRADREKELSELPNEYSDKLWKNAYERGKADERNSFFNFDKVIKIECDKARADERKKILGMVDFKYSDDEERRIRNIELSFDSLLSPEQVLGIILEKLKEQANG